jgi:hypothetical protein
MPEHAALITVLILDRPMCLDCIVAKTEIGMPSVRAHLEHLSKIVTVRQEPHGRCLTCGNVGHTIAIIRSNASRP